MLLYRISLCKRALDVSGTGAKLFGGRWNSVGIPVLYLASSRALAALEVLAHLTTVQDPETFCVTIFDVPASSIQTIEKELLPKNWNSYPSPSLLKKRGDAFAKANEALLLKVPSAIVEDEYNYILNVNHPLSLKVKIIDSKPFLFDKRLH
ncbi:MULTISPECIES: RES family NAD+ phosphorylase [Pedobacter]|uniref:RES domain protein n=1 Tax=Pedobacter heparinus (strain ATCC 13125 / DSM 2366 / CIP 104194 / JCM 7457 / NBRC 12017 / NCIMB 9290 / NRRL B-14731 / HIM 762-3) TaxID=485917 RepID=C6Y465_PEDHD|nr:MULTISPECIES: RES family NAD+ phosphorylase [Pedobacter]ACU05508.1 RES domain protein [Pedobacter heparinus DSM 2366]MBB5440528.1 RES domain-containing protein [Pedobacter sp. AK017]